MPVSRLVAYERYQICWFHWNNEDIGFEERPWNSRKRARRCRSARRYCTEYSINRTYLEPAGQWWSSSAGSSKASIKHSRHPEPSGRQYFPSGFASQNLYTSAWDDGTQRMVNWNMRSRITPIIQLRLCLKRKSKKTDIDKYFLYGLSAVPILRGPALKDYGLYYGLAFPDFLLTYEADSQLIE